MCKNILLFLVLSFNSLPCVYGYEVQDFWNSRGELTANWYALDEGQRAFVLERVYSEISFCVANRGRRFAEIEVSKVGNDRGYRRLNVIGSGLIALKYMDDYHDPMKAVEYFEKAWNTYKKCSFVNSDSNCDWPFMETSPLDFIMGLSLDNRMYRKLLEFYPEAYEDKMKRLSIGTDVKLLKDDFVAYKKWWPQEAVEYQKFMRDWERAKQLVKTVKPKPLEPAVQSHKWFYSDKQEEVLKALEYYHKHNVRLMLEKASKRDDKVISAKAKEYLDNPFKPKEETGDEKKK